MSHSMCLRRRVVDTWKGGANRRSGAFREFSVTSSAQHAAPVLVRSETAATVQDGALSLITLLADAGDTGGALTADKATPAKG